MIQLSLLDLPPVEEVEGEPQPIAPPFPLPLTSAERHTLRWLNAKSNYYLSLMNRFIDGNRCRRDVRLDEMLRVYELREVVLAEIEELERTNGRQSTKPVEDRNGRGQDIVAVAALGVTDSAETEAI